MDSTRIPAALTTPMFLNSLSCLESSSTPADAFLDILEIIGKMLYLETVIILIVQLFLLGFTGIADVQMQIPGFSTLELFYKFISVFTLSAAEGFLANNRKIEG